MNLNSGADLDSLPILDNPDNLVVYFYAAFIWKLSYVAINTVPQFRSSRRYSTCSFTKQRLLISCIPFFAPLSTWYHRSRVFLVLKYRILFSAIISAICVSSQSTSLIFTWAPDKNYGRSSMAYHLFVNGATFFFGMWLFLKWKRQAWLRWNSWRWLAALVCLCAPSFLPWTLVFCRSIPVQSLKTTLDVSPQRTTCICMGAVLLLRAVSDLRRNPQL